MSLLLLFLWLSFKQDHINYRIQFNSLVLSNDSLNSAIQGECPVKHYLALGAELSSLEYTGIIHFEHNHTHTTYTCRSPEAQIEMQRRSEFHNTSHQTCPTVYEEQRRMTASSFTD